MNAKASIPPHAWNVVRAAVVLAILLLSGCASKGPEPEPVASVEEPPVADGLYTIRGVVVDATITPIAGADVRIEGTDANTTTDEAGAFIFERIPAGTYFLVASKFNHADVKMRVDIVDEGISVRIVMELPANQQPLVVPLQYDGHITCSLRIPNGGFATGCIVGGFVDDIGGDRAYVDIDGGNVAWSQTELVWTPQSTNADKLCVRIVGYGEPDLCGASSLMQYVDEAGAEAGGIGMGTRLEVIVWADYVVDGVLGIVAEQPFQAFTHVFYNTTPPSDWLFSRDGTPA